MKKSLRKKRKNSRQRKGGNHAMSSLPIYKAGDDIPANEKYYYLLGEDGIFMHKTTHFYAVTIKVDTIGGLGKIKEQLVLSENFKMIPWEIIKEALDFFRAVYAKHKSEGIVLLGFNKETNAWFLIPVEQEVEGAHVDYKINGSKGAVGTIHSHPSFGAFYSATDDHDDKQFDGIHIVLGQITDEIPKIEASAVVNGNRFEFKPEQLIANIPKSPKADKTHEWMDKFVSKKSYSPGKGVVYRSGVHKYYRTEGSKNKKDDLATTKTQDSQLQLLTDKEVDAIIKRSKKNKDASVPFADQKTGGKKMSSLESDIEEPSDFAAECHFALVKQEINNLELNHLEELAEHVQDRIEEIENSDYWSTMKEDEESVALARICCPVCHRKTDYGSQRSRWCSTCQIQIAPEDCVMPEFLINDDTELPITEVDMCGVEPEEDAAINKLTEEFERDADEEQKKTGPVISSHKSSDRVYCKKCHSLTIPFTEMEEDSKWRWCIKCGGAVNRSNGMLSADELTAFYAQDPKE